ncbi:MAG: hypothetical protein WCA32_05360 [Chromatiaceae bacterium]|jgi:hypothetical protein
MANPPDDNTSMYGVTTGSGKRYSVPETVVEQASFMCAAIVGLNNLETRRELSSADAAIRLELTLN